MSNATQTLTARFHATIREIPASAWDALRPDDNPFLSHAFLAALEDTGCIREAWGWQAYHLGLYAGETLVAAAPLYLKGNSHGEFVFDWSWASAWERAGGDYYPKLLNAVPYSPVPGPRLLVGAEDTTESTSALRRALVEVMRSECDRLGLSSLHANFLHEPDLAAFDHPASDGTWLARSDVQFHWHNAHYADFDAFLTTFNHKKRKNIRQERAQVARSGLTLERCSGASLSQAEWRRVHALYEAAFDAKGNHAALSEAFFLTLGEVMGDRVQLALARRGDEIVAMALLLRSEAVLYGRYWGASEDVPGLHFELCYYQGIEYAIAEGLTRFEPGAQGRHKLARGFLPVRTHSRHYLAHPQFRQAVRDALEHEADSVEDYAQELLEHSPYARGRHDGDNDSSP